MNKTKIDWCDYTWNPIVGCSRGCPYCYARRINQRFKYTPDFSVPTFFPERLPEPARVKKPSWVFVCSMGELFDPKVPDEWRDQVFAAMRAAPQHTYVLLTKRPSRVVPPDGRLNERLPTRCIIGQTVDRDVEAAITDACFLTSYLHRPSKFMLCVEPLREHMRYLLDAFVGTILRDHVDWLIIGAQTGANAIKPEPAWISELVEAAQAANVSVWVKDNAKPYCKPEHFIQQRPTFEE